jgi:PTH1 family peptidyl-tRNA hydrolase
MKIVLGIGNPEEKYAETRHNVGWKVVEALSAKMGQKFRKAGFEFWAAEGRLGRHDVVLVKTWTYVNATGRAVPELRKRYGEEMMVVSDDVALPVGRLRVRKGGSSGGHNGLQSIIDALGTDEFPRLRIGVGGGRPDPDYVLARFTKEERPAIEAAVDRACEAVRCWLDRGLDACMNTFNRRDDE